MIEASKERTLSTGKHKTMNVVEIGKFIAELRKEKGLTQDGLGEALGVTNKTGSVKKVQTEKGFPR